MEQQLKIHKPESETQPPALDYELTRNIMHRHLTNMNDNITDDDIRNVRIDLEGKENNSESIEEKSSLAQKNEIVNDDDDMSPLWNIFS